VIGAGALQKHINVGAAMTCPKCGTENTDDWPLEINGEIKGGGCQDCWEIECDNKWWLIMWGKKCQ